MQYKFAEFYLYFNLCFHFDSAQCTCFLVQYFPCNEFPASLTFLILSRKTFPEFSKMKLILTPNLRSC